MKKNSILLYVIIMILAVIMYNTFNSKNNNSFKDLNNQIDSLENSIENNKKIIESYDEKIEIIKDSIVKLDNKVEENNKSIKKLDQEYEERFDSISNFYGSELQEYVSNRYKDK